MWLRRNTAITVKMGPFVDNFDGYTFKPALTIAPNDVRLSKNGSVFFSGGTGGVYDIDGMYTVGISATDTNTIGTLRMSISKTGALMVWQDFMVVSEALYDSMLSVGIQDVHVVDVSPAALIEIADEILKRDWTQITGEAERSLLNAARFLRNKWTLDESGSLTVFKENDTSVGWTGAATRAPGVPVTGVDPA